MFFPRILVSLPPLPCQHLAAIGRTNYQPIGVTVHSHCIESFEAILHRCRRGRGCSEFWKNTIFLEHPVALSVYFSILSVCDQCGKTFMKKYNLQTHQVPNFIHYNVLHWWTGTYRGFEKGEGKDFGKNVLKTTTRPDQKKLKSILRDAFSGHFFSIFVVGMSWNMLHYKFIINSSPYFFIHRLLTL